MSDLKWPLVSIYIAGIAGALLAPVTALMALSLVMQAGRILLQHPPTAFTSWTDCFNWCFQWLGRIVLAAMLLACVLVDDVITPEKLGLDMSGDAFLWYRDVVALRRAVLVVGIMTCLGWNSIPRRVSVQRRPWQWLFSIMIVPLAGLWALAVWEDSSTITRLVHYAILGVEMSGPLKFANPAISALPMHRAADFCQVAGVASIAAIISACSCRTLINSSMLNRHWRLYLGVLMVAGWAIQAAFLHWVYWDGFYTLSPAWIGEIGLDYGHVAATAFVLTVLLGAMIAYRGSAQPRENVSEACTPPRKRSFHESRLALALVTVAATGQMLPYLEIDFVNSEACLWMALFVFGVVQICAGGLTVIPLLKLLAICHQAAFSPVGSLPPLLCAGRPHAGTV